MSEEIENEKTESRSRLETITLSKETSKKIDGWVEQISSKQVRLSRKALINWLLGKLPKKISNSDLSEIVEQFYNRDKFLRGVLRGGLPDDMEIIVRKKKATAERDPNDTADNSEEIASPS
jgi:hypothetical protein